jgi:hypothetical protein
MNKLKIIANLHQIKNSNKIVASIAKYTNEIDFTTLATNNEIIRSHSNFSRKYLIINVDDYSSYDTTSNIFKNNTVTLNINTFKFFRIIESSSEFLNYYNKNINFINYNNNKLYKTPLDINNIFKELFINYYKEQNKKFYGNLMEYNVIFIFNNIIWSNIVFWFKLYYFELFGGSGNRRHLLSITQSNLTEFLLILNNMHLSNHIIKNSFNEKSSTEARLKIIISKGIKESKFYSIHLNYFEHLNIKIRQYLLILDKINKLNKLYYEINILDKKILDAKKRISKYTVPDATQFHIKKLKNANLSYFNFTNEKKNLFNIIPIQEQDLQKEINVLYLIDPNLFNEKNECKFDTDIIRDTSFNLNELIINLTEKSDSNNNNVENYIINNNNYNVNNNNNNNNI